jgi:hypothetical protein
MKRRIILSAFIFVIAILTGFSYGLSGERETRDLDGFTKVGFGVSGNLYIDLGSEFKVILEGDNSLLEDIVTEVSGDRLIIKKKNWRLNMNQKVTIYITMPEIEGLTVSGSGRAEIKDAVKIEDLVLSVSGSGNILTSDVTAESMKCSISGSGNITLGGGGDINNADLSISGSGSYRGETAKAGSADVSISGSGNCSCYVTESLMVRVSGSGNVTYAGNPKIDARISGSGKVRSR